MMQKQIKRERTSERVTELQSENLVNTILTMSLGCIAYLRGFFDDHHFADETFVVDLGKAPGNDPLSKADYIKLKSLVRGKSKEADSLLDWLEMSCFESIRLKYVSKICLSIILDDSKPNEVCESYMFEIDYFEDIVKLKGVGLNWEMDEKSTMSGLRRSIQTLMRQFIVITQTLPTLPTQRYMSMRMMFNDRAPLDYQPDLFFDCSDSIGEFGFKIPKNDRIDFISCGLVESKYHHFQSQIMSLPDYNTETTVDLKVVNPLFYMEDTRRGEEYCDSDVSQITKALGDLVYSKDERFVVGNTQKLILSSSADNIANSEDSVVVRCECGSCKDLQYSPLVYCGVCHEPKHKVCYGIGPTIKNRAINCLSCSNPDSISKEKIGGTRLLMNLRKLLRIFTSFLMPEDISMEGLALLLGYGTSVADTYETIALAFNIMVKEKLIVFKEDDGQHQQQQLQKLSNLSTTTAVGFLNTPPNSTAVNNHGGKEKLTKGCSRLNISIDTKIRINTGIKDSTDRSVLLYYPLTIRDKRFLSDHNVDIKFLRQRRDFYMNLEFEGCTRLFGDPPLFREDGLRNDEAIDKALRSSSRVSSSSDLQNKPEIESKIVVFDSNFSQFTTLDNRVVADGEDWTPDAKRRKVSQSQDLVEV